MTARPASGCMVQQEQPAARRTLIDQVRARLKPDKRRVGADDEG
jgi:hypothetical protein